MSLETVMDKTRLAAFADGELTPEEAAKVVMHLADHPQDQAYVDNLMAANEFLLQAFSAPMNQPVPAEIKQAIMGEKPAAQVVPFRRKPAVWAGGAALAASVALALVTLPQIMATSDGRLALTPGPVAMGSTLSSTLNSLPSGVPQSLDADREVMILATLPVKGGFCREIEVVDNAAEQIDLGLACRTDGAWAIVVTMSEPLVAPGTEDGFVTASGDETLSLNPVLDQMDAGSALDAATEIDLIKRGWRP
ncbi:anti-sigma factor family protein [Roseovarius sp. 2305UL8-3]|uniref:anti-sigma factor family protein n=1 Tax=Roseovarius conchicola TaxID=3121636 RepID=UPI003527D34A